MREDLSVEARLLAERLRRLLRAGSAKAAGLEAEGGEHSSVAWAELDRLELVRPAEAIDLSVWWSALDEVRAEIELEPATQGSRARQHHQLDRAAYELTEAVVQRTIASNHRAIEEISHDIRSPLNSILLLADSLHQELGGRLTAVQKREAAVLYTAAVSLVRLVNDLMDIARLSSDGRTSIARAPFSLNEVLAETRRLVSPLALHRSVELKFEPASGRRVGDRQLLCRVLLNLASNAVEAAGNSGTVVVRLDESDAGSLRASVRDSGEDADLEKLRGLIADSSEFYPRYRQGWTRGLGLSLAGRLVRAAGGELSVARATDDETRFTVLLPFERV